MSDSPNDLSNRRRIRRVNLSLPIKVEGKDGPEEPWNQMSRTKTVSAYGAGFMLEREVYVGQLLQLSLAMPQSMRSYDFIEPQYRVWAIVRHCLQEVRDGKPAGYIIGVAFLGRKPPASYFENPRQLYEVTLDPEGNKYQLEPSAELGSAIRHKERIHSRYSVPVSLDIKVLDNEGNTIKRESTVTENISFGGASIFSSINIEVGAELVVTSDQYGADLTAIVRGRRIGDDGIPRLHVEFMNGLFPLKGIDI